MDEDKVIGYVKIEELRDKFEPNYKVYVFTGNPITKLGEFDYDNWDYAYLLERKGIDIDSIEEAKTLPRILDALVRAIKEHYSDEVPFQYVITLRSSLRKSDVEWEIENWLRKEGVRVKVIEVLKLPRVKRRKKIPITESMLNEVLKKKKA